MRFTSKFDVPNEAKIGYLRLFSWVYKQTRKNIYHQVIEMSPTYQIMQLNIILTLEKSLAALTIRL